MCLLCVLYRELELSSVSETTEGEGLSLHHPHLICGAAPHPLGPSSSPKPPLRHPSLCLSAPAPSPLLLWSTRHLFLYNPSQWPLTRLSTQRRTHSWTSVRPSVRPVASQPTPNPFPSLSQQRNSSAGNKFASETHTPACQGHFRGILLHRNPLKGPRKSPNDLQLQLSQVVSEN